MIDSILLQESLRFRGNVARPSVSSEGFGDVEVLAESSHVLDEGASSSSVHVHMEPPTESIADNAICVSLQVHVVGAHMLERIVRDDWVNWWEI